MNEKTAIPIQFSAPVPGTSSTVLDTFNGTVSGVISPPVSDLSSVTITCSFFPTPDASGPATGNPQTCHPTSSTGWQLTFPPDQLPTAPTACSLQASKTVAGSGSSPPVTSPPITDKNLSWTPPNHEFDAKLKLGVSKPEFGDTVGRVFLVYGDYRPADPKDGDTVSVALLRGDDSPALAVVLPTEYVAHGKWVTAVYALESGSNYVILATLRKKTDQPVLLNSVGNITIVG
ncbi:hypothetical protein [Frigoriglobus tundricola]|uniref:Uncharacterized protein n=1 Tax=Frigoriglobus tundricola TaxID=2774151 RepID=A0A6M5YUP6_9BACT|nr:hypothetical protein [Frigoriglobus tundricola]QJW96981.1 hypothetical protein FTUN_4541 [Frigoriglobus tundricola]